MVLDASVERGRGIVTDLLLQSGSLGVGDIVVVGRTLGKVKLLLDEAGKPVSNVGPARAVRMLGMRGMPTAGEEVREGAISCTLIYFDLNSLPFSLLIVAQRWFRVACAGNHRQASPSRVSTRRQSPRQVVG